MSDVLIIAVGSRGDVAPLAGVGVALQRAGHRVNIAAYSPFGDLIRDCGLGYCELPAELELASDGADVAPTQGLAAFASPKGMRALGENIISAVTDVSADIVLLSPFAEMAGHPLAEARGVPAVGARLQPLSATAQHPPTVLGAWSAGAIGNRAAAQAGSWMVDRVYAGVVRDLRGRLGLPRASAHTLRRRRTEARWTVLHGYSTVVAPKPPDWRPGLEVTGYWWAPSPPDYIPPSELLDFLAAGPPPVFVGFGSTMTTPQRAEQLSDIIAQAARHAGVRALVQAGWTSLHVADDAVLTIDDVPHDWLFPQMSAVAHHCGAGTTAAGIRAGVPTIALPGYGDGAFWAERISALGIAAGTIPQRTLTVERLSDAIRTAIDDPGLRVRSREISKLVSAEDGVGGVVSVVESILG